MKKSVVLMVMGVLMGVKTMSAQEVKNVFTYKLGACEVSLLSEGQRDGNKGILIGATSEMLRETAPEGTFPNASNAYVIRTLEKIILVDAGYGSKLFDNLQSLGIWPDQVDAVVITHMHGDHIGGMIRDGKISFPKAEVYLSQPEHDYWMSDEKMNELPENRRGGFQSARAVIAAYKEKLHLFQPTDVNAQKIPLIPGLYGIAAYGHTPGHTAFLVESGNKKLMIWSDLTHAMAVQMPYPQVAVTYDVNPEEAIAARKEILKFVSEKKIPIAGMHIAYPGMGKISASKNGGYNFIPFK